MLPNHLKAKMNIVPKKPGCYLWKNQNQEIIYIGKAKNLFNRTHSYFSKSNNLRTQKMVSEIKDLDYFIVKNENEALILESTLINKHRPKYNVLLRENKNYPYLFLTKEAKPRLLYTRKKIANLAGQYFGPFATSGSQPFELYNLLKKILPIQDCKHNWNQECFNCEILKRIKIPLLAEDQQDFKSIVNLINKILQSKSTDLIDYLKQQENQSKNNWDFETAHKFLNLQKALIEINQNRYIQISRSQIDVIGFKVDENFIAITIFSWVNEKLIAKTENVFAYVEDWKNSFNSFLYEIYKQQKTSLKVYLSYNDELIKLLESNLKVKFVVPRKGKFLELITIAMQNAESALEKYLLKHNGQIARTAEANHLLKELLELSKLKRIEVFDVSQFFGTYPVGAMVVYENGLPIKNQYRKYLIKNAEGTSDYQCLKEVLYRRYTNLTNPKLTLPDLIIIDGGKTHLNLLEKCLVDLALTIPAASLVKDNKHRTRTIIYQKQEVKIDKPNLIYYLTNIQDEVHRFAITFFKKRNIKGQMKSVLDDVSGLGKTRIKLLLDKYHDVYQLQKAETEELSQLIPKKIAIALKQKLQNWLDQKQKIK
ncbi:Excinuclease ABC subunit C [[Mycoplasma] cavipharyngis]|uniref:excinuclease ABC subunit UvrC n=1 Tax=[Mycoplasma] cavipharyngis TaxID=92757 RepID=UPI003703B356